MHRPLSQLPGLRTPGASAPGPWLGANFWSRAGGPRMWREFDPGLVRRELAVLAEHGLRYTRSFFLWPEFMPEPDRVDEELCARFAAFLDLHTETGLSTTPTLVVGHMSGENRDPAWRDGRDLYQDVWMVARQAWFAGEMARRFAGHPAVAGWVLTNEMPLYGGEGAREHIASWAQLLIDGLRAGGATQPVTIGDGAWGLEVSGHDNGFRLADAARLCDFIGPHCYPMGDDQVRQHYAAAWVCELAGSFGRPVLLEEFGVTSDFVSEENAAHFHRQVLHNSLLAGSSGWGVWNNTDFDGLEHQDPYRHHAFELHFGLTDAQGTPKPRLLELARFAEVLERVGFAGLRRTPAETALVVTSYLDTQYPFTDVKDGPFAFDTLRQAYVGTRLADLPVGIARESAGIEPGAKLYLVPSTKQLLSPTWYRLAELAEGGATVYVSYTGGTHLNQRGPWYANINSLFGVRHKLRYGLIEPVPEDGPVFTFTQPFGSFAAGAQVRFPAGTGGGRGMLPVEAVDAEVVAVDGEGRPALLLRRVGTGAVVLCTYPIEQLAASTPEVNPDPTREIYDALARIAGVERPVVVEDRYVAADVLTHTDGSSWAWLVSQADHELTVKPVLGKGLRLGEAVTPDTAVDAQGTVTLGPFGVAVVRLEREEG
ncbi:cellulase family glycosylhydrolase [Actinospica durhamensis]|uniref:Cellulase family glycosylhydrolase n=1 Tax=Actinospica durhamensis TaxID=1508375 RepID=A0A941ENY8_9ACTN|nr:cellulase family glycosylhydrolase [Actinospica durhamensis]MBR7834721.1 cellulase family glycosylhydrolase [Actinospica durhamensis]